jgi:hypothetical protein
MIKCIFAPNYYFFFIQGWVRHGITLSDSIPYDQIRNYSLILQQPHLREKIRLHDVQQIGIYFNQFAIPVHSEVWESTHSTDDCSSIEAFGHICPAAHHGCC